MGFNKNLKFRVNKLRVCNENEHIYTDEFWDNISFVLNAVDNVKAREYVDQKCVFHDKALFESGTMGTQCNSQLILPYLTESYQDSSDQEEKNIPVCTIRNFPYLIDHTIEWARDYFEKQFVEPTMNIEQLNKDPRAFIQKKLSELKTGNVNQITKLLQNILNVLKTRGQNFMLGCLKFAKELFVELFYNQINTLLFNLPLDHKD